MTVRTARRGSRAGNQFWGCRSYPACKGTKPFDGPPEVAARRAQSEAGQPSPPPFTASIPVVWSDARARVAWISEYALVGAMPGVVRDHADWSDGTLARLLGVVSKKVVQPGEGCCAFEG
jgi:hypothetical protein